MFLIGKDEELTVLRLGKILQQFQTKELPQLKHYRNYYDGKQNILLKQATDTGKPCNKIVVNYCANIVDNYLGYLTGIPISYSNDDSFSEILDILKYNDYQTEDNELLRQALIYGVAYEINYVDEDGKQRFRVLDSRECIPVYDNTLNNDLQYVIRFWKEDLVQESTESYVVEVYSNTNKKVYKSSPGFTTFELKEESANFFNQCPITVFKLNADSKSIFDQIITLQDSYNRLLSDEVDDFDSFADAYLVLKGVTADDEDLKTMKQNRVLMIDADCDAGYLTKSINDTQIQNMLQNVNDKIYNIAACPDFTDEKFYSQSGVAIQYKLINFENKAADIVQNMKKALQRRIELITSILTLTDGESMWRDVEIVFTRNLPNSLTPTNVTELISLRHFVSDETLLKLLPFVSDVKQELVEVKKQTEENMQLYSLNNPQQEVVDEE